MHPPLKYACGDGRMGIWIDRWIIIGRALVWWVDIWVWEAWERMGWNLLLSGAWFRLSTDEKMGKGMKTCN